MRRILLALCLAMATLALGPASAATAAKEKPVPSPVIKSVTPLKLAAGEVLTIQGTGFRKGRFKNTVIFRNPEGATVWVRADDASTRKIRLRVPAAKITPFLRRSGLVAQDTRFSLKVVARKAGKRFTSSRLSPVIGPPPLEGADPGNPDGGVGPVADCDADGVLDSSENDDDNDLISDVREKEIGTAPCLADTDGDSMEDGWEYESALDFNSRALPYPGKRPYPNPLDGSDAFGDHDNDDLKTIEEYAIWAKFGGHRVPLNYSDGDQTTGDPVPAPAGQPWMDINGDGFLSDDEKDADGDGIGNWDEIRGALDWRSSSDNDKYPLDYLDPDTDGDGVLDGADDQDHDGYSNVDEILPRPTGDRAFDPCDPDPNAQYCYLH